MDMSMTPLILATLSGFLLLGITTMTGFIKVTVVFLIIRQALGLQQIPNNIVIMALSGFIAVFISLPVISASLNAILATNLDATTPQALLDLWTVGVAPFREFISKNSDPAYAAFFIETSIEAWEGSGFSASEGDLIIQIPTFMVSELTEAFRIGFLLYLPFVAIDLAVTGILMALGMQMVQPNIIAVPFKLLTFVFVDGWSRLAEGLIMTYGV